MNELINDHGQTSLVINTDGGSRGNPGHAAIGVVISTPSGQHLESFGRYIGETTNNQAEYQAVVEGLKMAEKYQPESIKFILDSELVVKQLNGQYKVKNADLQPIHADITRRAAKFQTTFTHVLRAQNAMADIEVNRALDDYLR